MEQGITEEENVSEMSSDGNYILMEAKAFRKVIKLGKTFPNDYELGRYVREEINKQKTKKR